MSDVTEVKWTDHRSGSLATARVRGEDVYVCPWGDEWRWGAIRGDKETTTGWADTRAEAKAAAEAHARSGPDSGEMPPGQHEYLVETVDKVDVLAARSHAGAARLWAKTAKATVGAQVRVSRLVETRTFAVGVREVGDG